MALEDVLFLDLEPYNSDHQNRRTREMGVLIDDLAVKDRSIDRILGRLSTYHPKYMCGHNIRNFDKEYLENSSFFVLANTLRIIDTLELSLLFFSENTVHKLPKQYKENDPRIVNDPMEDALITKELLLKIIDRFNELPDRLKSIYGQLLGNQPRFKPFFELINFKFELNNTSYIKSQIKQEFATKIQSESSLESVIEKHPIELAYILSVLHDTVELKSFPLKVYKDYPGIQDLLNAITFDKEEAISNLEESAEQYFGFNGFRTFPKQSDGGLFDQGSELSQKEIVVGALEREDLLAVLPTGGGKTFTFWLPAIIKAKSTRGLTVVISPLQALMKDHIYNFNKKLMGLASAEALSGYLTLPERRNIINRIISGQVDILYLAPESLRSKNMERILSNRYIERIVVDEAHCLSTWGNDFRHDYFYIAQFIKKLIDHKYNQSHIPISCFTATANKKTIEDIEHYFDEHLGIRFRHYIASPKRTNLKFHATQYDDKKEKNKALIEQVRHIREPLLIYNPSSRKQCEMIADQLHNDLGRPFSAFHAGMANSDKQQVLDDYIKDNVDGIVATTAFGMGIDKPNIRHVVHYEPSSSLEDYMQEAGRAGRDGEEANCHVLYKDDDFDKLFFSLIRSKVTHAEIKKIFQAIRHYKGKIVKGERQILVSVQELAESAGMAVDEEGNDYDTKVKTAILELERAGYVRRGYNKPNVWVTAFHFKSMEELRQILGENGYGEPSDDPKKTAVFQSSVMIGQIMMKRSMQRFSMKIEELAEHLNIDTDELYRVLDVMRDMDLVSLNEDLVISDLFVKKLQSLIKEFSTIGNQLYPLLQEFSHERFKLKDMNQSLKDRGTTIGFADYSYVLKNLLANISKRGVFEFYRKRVNEHYWYCKIIDQKGVQDRIKEFVDTLIAVAKYIQAQQIKDNRLVVEYHTMVHHCNNELNRKIPVTVYDKVVLYLHRLRLLRLEGGRVLHHMRLELFLDDSLSANKQYTKENYKERMLPMYDRKRAAIHIINHYVDLLKNNPISAQDFSTDYFTMDYEEFVKKYKLTKKLRLPVSRARYDKIKSGLTDEQKEIIFDDKTQTMLILAGPGTGKTMVMVNKIAHMILDEDYKPEHFLMLTFTRTAAHEFKRRLFDLLGDLAYDIDIYTFHAYATELAGISFNKNGTAQDDQQLKEVIHIVTKKLHDDSVVLPFKNAIVLDEFQDTNEESFRFIKALFRQFAQMKGNDRENDVRIIAVGDDDQCIMEMTNGANIGFMREFVESFNSDDNKNRRWYKLSKNFRSLRNIVATSNTFAAQIRNRIDAEKKIVSSSMSDGQVNLTYYQSPHFLGELYELVKNSNSQSVAILAHENDQVLDIYSVLKQDEHLDVSYLLKNEGFHLYMLDEIAAFTHYLLNNLDSDERIISQQLFDDAKKHIKQEYAESKKLNLAMQHIVEFESEHDLLTISFWENFIYEVFVGALKNVKSKIVVSTIHRAKGKEWDEVHVVLQKVHNMNTPDYFQRLYYVAMTRARFSLHIHAFPQQPFKVLETPNVKVINGQKLQLNLLKERIVIMELEDAYLSYLSHNSHQKTFVENNSVLAGSPVTLSPYSYNTQYGQKSGYRILYQNIQIGQVSKAFARKLEKHKDKGYEIKSSEIEYVAKWFEKNSANKLNVFLCRVTLALKN